MTNTLVLKYPDSFICFYFVSNTRARTEALIKRSKSV